MVEATWEQNEMSIERGTESTDYYSLVENADRDTIHRKLK